MLNTITLEEDTLSPESRSNFPEMIDLIMLQHPYRFCACMKAVQPKYVLELIANNNYQDPADEFSSPVIKPKQHSNTDEDNILKDGENENIKVFPLSNFKSNRPLTEKEIIEKEKLKQGILTFN